MIRKAVLTTASHHGATGIIAAGIGSAIVSGWMGGADLRKALGEYAHALPAWAVREVALRKS